MSYPTSHSVQSRRRWTPYEVSLRTLGVGLLLSFLFHLGMILFASKYQGFLKRQEPQTQPIEVTLAPSRALDSVQTFQETAKEAPKNPHFASDRNLTTDKETSPESAATQLPKIGGAKSQESKKKSSQQRKVEKGFSISSEELIAKGEMNQETLKQDSQGVTSPGFYEHLSKGEQLKVNAAYFDYGNYILRMKEKISQHWRPDRNVPAKMYDYSEIKVDVGVVLNSKGEIVELRILDNSIFAGFDQEALRALREAGPYPNPPKSLIQDDGLVYMPWSFILSLHQWGTPHVE